MHDRAMASTTAERPLSPEELKHIHACWRAANYLASGDSRIAGIARAGE